MGCRDCDKAVDDAGPAGAARYLQWLSAPPRVRPAWAAALVCAAIAMLAWSAPALALSQRGHAFSLSFGKKGTADGQLSSPVGVAVNEKTGDLYVVDSANNRVERFTAAGEFLETWGFGVLGDGKEAFETCKKGEGVEGKCHAGTAGAGEGQFNSPQSIAVDNSTSESAGDVYVVSETAAVTNAIEKFGPTGVAKLPHRLKFAEAVVLGGVAVDSNGKVWAYENEAKLIESFDGKEPNVNVPTEAIHLGVECGAPGFAVDAKAEAFYVNHERQSLLQEASGECPEVPPSPKTPAVTAKVKVEGTPGEKQGEPLIEALDNENTTGMAVDLSPGQQESGDVYINNLTSIAAFDVSGSPVQRFGTPEELGTEAELKKGSGVAVDAKTGQIYVADTARDRVAVFAPRGEGAPEVDGLSAQNLSTTSTELKAQIDPRGLETEYFFEYGTADCKANPGTCTKTPTEKIKAGLFGDQPVKATLVGLQSGVTYFYRVIAKNAKGENEKAETVNTFTTVPNPKDVLPDGREWELVSPPEKSGAGVDPIQAGPFGGITEASADGSAVTYVTSSPIVREPEGSGSPEGTQILANRSSSAWSNQDIVTPREAGEGLPSGRAQEYHLFSSDLSFALVEPSLQHTFNGFQEPPLVGEPGEVKREEAGLYRRNNATCPTVRATCFQPLVTGGPRREPLLAPEQANDLTNAAFGGKIGDLFNNQIPMSTPDLNHVVFPSEVALTAPTPTEGEGVDRLYEWTAGKPPAEQLQLVSILPKTKAEEEKGEPGEPAPEPQLGDFIQGTDARNAISADGSRVIWTGRGNTEHLYMRDMTKGQTVQIDAPAPGVKKLSKEEEEALGEAHVRFQIASNDGSKIFFTDRVPLTTESQLRPTAEGPSDLYVCEVIEVAGKLECSLKDLTVDQKSGQIANVVGKVMGTSTDGSSVYFAADGVLAPNVEPGNCLGENNGAENAGAMCNLYLVQYNKETKAWGPARFIARVSQEDEPDWGTTGALPLTEITSRVSPNGRFLAFMSDQELTGYNNVDANPEAKARDEEVFVYDASTQGLVCASCNPSGKQPHGVHDVENSGEGNGLLVDRPHVWTAISGGKGRVNATWLAGSIPAWTPLEPNSSPYQSRYLSDQGRLFFNAADALVPHDTNGKEDVYQYEPNGVGGCGTSPGCIALISSGTSKQESAFLDASTSGNDVFFVTAAQLVPADVDQSFDIYDARVCGASPCIKSEPPKLSNCATSPEANTCKPPESPHPGFSTPLGPSGPGNLGKHETLPIRVSIKPKGLSNSQKLAKALTQCRKRWKHSHKKRVACEKQARHRYPAKKAAKKATIHKRAKR
jgi:DNA-binding beta-propeller fold protein YncE